MKLILNLLFFILTIHLSIAQSDKDIKEKEVPQEVKDYVKSNFKEAKSINYYKEIKGDTTFYEVEFKYNNDRYSLLFLPNGNLYETEKVMGVSELPSQVKENIVKDLERRFIKFKIQLVEQVNPQGESKYEIKVHAKKNNHTGIYELFYDKDGNYISEEEEILKSIPSNSGF